MGYMETLFRAEVPMRKSKFTDEQIIAILAELDHDRVDTLADRYGVSSQTIYLWKKRFGLQSGPPRRPLMSAFKLQLGEPVATDLEDFCAAHYGAPAINVIREAVTLFIVDQLARDPELRMRFDRLRQERTEKSVAIRKAAADMDASSSLSSFPPHDSTDAVRALRRK
jgi:hypothetical protein